MSIYRIGEIAERIGLSVDTLRYYEKIGLLPRVARDVSGLRVYNDEDVSRVRFVQRAQRMNFTLAEIADLLRMRENPQRARAGVRMLTAQKLADIEVRLGDLRTLRRELRLLLDLCAGGAKGCPIIDGIDKPDSLNRRSETRGRKRAK